MNSFPRQSRFLFHTLQGQRGPLIDKAKSIGHGAKHIGQVVNLQVGKGLAKGIDQAEWLGHEAKEVSHTINMKAGQGLAKGIDKVENKMGQWHHRDPHAMNTHAEQQARDFWGTLPAKKADRGATAAGATQRTARGKEKLESAVDEMEDAFNTARDTMGIDCRSTKPDKKRLEQEARDALDRLKDKLN
ncbi:hypothetical protein BC940DRAFT_345860 [Gongronella butleri]|nr:hypothetical protein BC940DRAFT_345860 [Gongronella butleri]